MEANAIYSLAMLVALLGMLPTLWFRGVARRTVGAVWFADHPLGNERKLLFGGLCVLALAAALAGQPLAGPPLFLAALLLWIQPRSQGQVLGELGVQVGWGAHAYDRLAEWRLTGDHLRFRVREEWRAVRVPVERREALLSVLEERAGDRQSRFRE